MMSVKIVVAILSLGVYATGELCVDSVLKVKMSGGSKASCDELIESDNLDCTQPAILHHCKKSCNVSFCCADSQASFEIKLDFMNKTKYKDCSWKPMKKGCDVPNVIKTCPVTCGKCEPMSVLLNMIKGQDDQIKGQDDQINDIQNEAKVQATMIGHQNETIKDQEDTIDELRHKVKGLETEVHDTFMHHYTYHVAAQKKTFAEHEEAAVEWGGHLASIHSAAEADYIRSLISQYSYIGLHRNVAGDFVNTDGTEYDYENWYFNRNINPNYKHTVIHAHSGKFYDVGFPSNFYGIYKKRIAD